MFLGPRRIATLTPRQGVPAGYTRTTYNGAPVSYNGKPVFNDGHNFYVRAA